MTVTELKAEAKKLGYRLVPMPEPPIKLLPCTCGHNRRAHWYTSTGMFFECQKCGRESPTGETEAEARRLWNEMVNKGTGK